MEKIDWFKANERSLRKYENFRSALAALGFALDVADTVVDKYVGATSSSGRVLTRVEPEELKAAQRDLYESLNSLVAKAHKHEAKLKSWEWQL